MNKNVVFNLKGVKPNVFVFDPVTCPFENFKMGFHNGHQEWCVKVLPPNAYRWIELFCKAGDVIMVIEFYDRNNMLVSYTAVSMPFEIANNYLECYDEREDDYVDLKEVFFSKEEEPTLEEIKIIDNELEDLLEKSKHLTIEDLLEDDE